MEMKINTTIPTIQEVIYTAKWFHSDPIEGDITAYLYEDNGGWRGYRIKPKYLHEVGYFWDLSGLWASKNAISVTRGNITADKHEAFKLLGQCPICGGDLLNKFNDTIHNIQRCNQPKKAINTNVIG